MTGDQFLVRFWGVRGSIACAGPTYERYGGNTPCVEMRCGSHVLIFDAGSGVRGLGVALEAEGIRSFDLFFSHCHYDHIEGIPFFAPFYCEEVDATLWSGHHLDGTTTEEMVEGFMRAPFFPVGPDVFKARLHHRTFTAGDTLRPHPDVTIATARLNHGNGATGYRVEHAGKAICYVTDTEHRAGQHDPRVLALIAGADVVIYDAMYTPEEFACCKGFGHSTFQEGVALCEEAGAGRLVLFHHSPKRDDEALARMEAEADAMRPGTLAAREGLTIVP